MTNESKNCLPLSGIRVLELSLAVMGPTCGLILADMGAEVIRVERAPEGDETRRLKGFGLGFFPFLNRNKKSIAIDLKSERGKEVLKKLILSADVLLENFAPGTIERLGFGYDQLASLNPRLIYCALKGFMPGPYEKRPALDEVVQMMSGLAYMTGPLGAAAPGRGLHNRYPGRNLRGHRDSGGASRAGKDGKGAVGDRHPLRIGGLPDGPAYGGFRDHGETLSSHAQSTERLVDLRPV